MPNLYAKTFLEYMELFRKYFAVILLICSINSTCLSQQALTCGFNMNLSGNQTSISEERNEILRIHELINELSQEEISNRSPIVVPIVFHILWHKENENISDQVILEQLDVLNKCFNGENEDIQDIPDQFTSVLSTSGFRFCLAQKDSSGKQQVGIIRKKVDRSEMGLFPDIFRNESGGIESWDTNKFLNIRVVNTGNSIFGYSSFPGVGLEENQGIVIHPAVFGRNSSRRYNLGRTLVHEVGHFFGLLHPWGVGGCDSDDDLEDTPLQESPYFGCPDFPQFSCGSEDIFITYMDYVDDSCMRMFTKGQMKSMQTVLKNLRPGLMESTSKCITNTSLNPEYVRIYPNPAGNVIHVDTDTLAFPATVNIVDVSGRIILMEKVIISPNTEIDVSTLRSGIYFLQIGQKYSRFIKL